MVQFNLLPEVKIKYIRARRQKRLIMLISMLVSAGVIAVFALTASYVYGVQGVQLASLNSSIEKSKNSISNKNSQVDDINKVLTIQNQLGSLDELHAGKPLLSRTFTYLTKLTPSSVTMSKLIVTHGETNTITIQGSTQTLETVNQFIDTLKFTTFTPAAVEGEQPQPVPVFSNVVLEVFGRDKKGASYTISMEYDPLIYKNTESENGLVVPSKVTTRSALGQPIFQTAAEAANNAPAGGQ